MVTFGGVEKRISHAEPSMMGPTATWAQWSVKISRIRCSTRAPATATSKYSVVDPSASRSIAPIETPSSLPAPSTIQLVHGGHGYARTDRPGVHQGAAGAGARGLAERAAGDRRD